MSGQYSIAFKGEVADGHRVEDVRLKFAERFNKKSSTIDRMFSGQVVTLARRLDWDKANAVINKLEAFGAVVYLVDADGKAVNLPTPANDPDASGTLETLPESAAAEAPVEPAQAAPAPAPEAAASEPDAEPAPAEEPEADPYDLTATAKVRHLTQITEMSVPDAIQTLVGWFGLNQLTTKTRRALEDYLYAERAEQEWPQFSMVLMLVMMSPEMQLA